MTPEQFISTYKAAAIQASKNTPILPDTVLAVAALESAWAKSELAYKYNNFFGIKATNQNDKDNPNVNPIQADRVRFLTTEYIPGTAGGFVPVKVNAWFRRYSTPVASFVEFVGIALLKRYTDLGMRNAVTPVQQFKILQAGGYASAPTYSKVLTEVYRRYINPPTITTGVKIAGASLLLLGLGYGLKQSANGK